MKNIIINNILNKFNLFTYVINIKKYTLYINIMLAFYIIIIIIYTIYMYIGNIKSIFNINNKHIDTNNTFINMNNKPINMVMLCYSNNIKDSDKMLEIWNKIKINFKNSFKFIENNNDKFKSIILKIKSSNKEFIYKGDIKLSDIEYFMSSYYQIN